MPAADPESSSQPLARKRTRGEIELQPWGHGPPCPPCGPPHGCAASPCQAGQGDRRSLDARRLRPALDCLKRSREGLSMIDTTRMSPAEQKAFYDEQGYILHPDLLNQDEVATLRAA